MNDPEGQMYMPVVEGAVREDGILQPGDIHKRVEFKLFDKNAVIASDQRFPLNLYDGPAPGFKLTDVHGGNGVICKIHPDEETKE